MCSARLKFCNLIHFKQLLEYRTCERKRRAKVIVDCTCAAVQGDIQIIMLNWKLNSDNIKITVSFNTCQYPLLENELVAQFCK